MSINGIPGTLARKGDNIELLANLGELQLKDFLKFNDIDITHRIIPGQVYYFKRKEIRPRNITIRFIPVRIAGQLRRNTGSRKKNCCGRTGSEKTTDDFEKGRIVWMRFIRPEDHPVEYAELPVVASSTQSGPAVDRILKISWSISNEQVARPIEMEENGDYIDTHLNKSEKADIEENTITEQFLNIFLKRKIRTQEGILHCPCFMWLNPGETLYGISRRYGITLDA
jgi:hypothetical protein